MRFMMLYKPGHETSGPPTQEEMERMGAFIEEIARTGVLLATDGLQPSSKGARVAISDGKFIVTDGPFAETKELVAGFAIVQVESKDEVIELARRFLTVVGEGVSEIRLMHDEAAFEADRPPQLDARGS